MRSEIPRGRSYLLAILLLVVTFGGMESGVLPLLLDDIKFDLDLSDMQLGILTGVAPAITYAVTGIPMARWADRGNRVTFIAFTTALSGVSMALYALAVNFPQLLLIRVGAVVGAAAGASGNPAVLSLLADYFSRRERPRAIAKCMLGYPLSGLIGYSAAGWLDQSYGWRMTYLLMGLPGLGLAAWAWSRLGEPRAARSESGSALASKSQPMEQTAVKDIAPPPRLGQVMLSLFANTTFRHLLSFSIVAAFVGIATAQFLPSFMTRSFNLKSGELGTWFALVGSLSGLAGMYWGGEWATRRAANNERLQLKAGAVAYSSLALLSALMYFSANRYMTFALMGVVSFVVVLPYGAIYAILQTLVPPRSRATATALVGVFACLFGLGPGPWVAGALSDAYRHSFGEESLRYAMITLCPGYLWAAWHLWRANATVTRDLSAIHEASDAAVSDTGLPIEGGGNSSLSAGRPVECSLPE